MTDIQAIKARHERRRDARALMGAHYMDDSEAEATVSKLLSLLTAAEARAEAAEARVKYLQTIIDCVVANCEASASSYQERIETIHRVTSALALEWAENSTLKGTPDESV